MAADAPRTLRFAAIGLDHRHIYEMTGRLLGQGCRLLDGGRAAAARRLHHPLPAYPARH